MVSQVNLRKTGTGWEFENEAALEDFVWANLTQIFGLTPLKRQHTVKGQFCDILALGENKQLVVLELKNVEDRYVVQQLTRYYDALREEMPFNEEVDYEQPIGLIAIAPSFHRDNFTDRKYCHLDVQFLRFQIVADGEKFYLQLKDVDSGKVWQVEIPHQERESNDNIPAPPRTLLKLLAKCTPKEQEGILIIRNNLLRFDVRMQETTSNVSINYGRGKSKPCAELRFDNTRNTPALFLWLPLITSGWKKKSFIARMRIWTDWETVSDVGHVPDAFGRMINRTEWKYGNVRPLNELLPKRKETKERFFTDREFRENYVDSYRGIYDRKISYKSPLAMNIKYYMQTIGRPDSLIYLHQVIEIAIETWVSRLYKNSIE